MAEPSRALVTGATGFVGGHLVRRLLEDGWEVHALTRAGSSALPAGVKAHVMDGGTAGVLAGVRESAPDVVFHLAALFLAAHGPDDVEPLVSSNVLFGAQLLEAMADLPRPCLVSAGTAWQHFRGDAYEPVNLYAATKQAFEDVAAYYVSARGLAMITLDLYDTYGPGDTRPRLLPMLLDAAGTGNVVGLSPGEQLLHFVHADDVAGAFLAAAAALQADPSPRAATYTVPSAEPITLRELVAVVERATGETIDVEWGARPYRDREVMVPWTGPVLPGWHPKVPLEEGLRAVAAERRTSGR